MKNKATFLNAGWDFNYTWGIWDGVTYPFLRWQGLKSIASASTNLHANVGDGHVNLTWNAPENDGGLTITEYRVYRNGTKIATVPANQLWYNDTNVDNGQTYTYYVTAVNAAGESPKSDEVQATPERTPGAIIAMVLLSLIIVVLLSLIIIIALRKRKN